MSLLIRLGELEKIETKLAAVYRSFAERFADDIEVSQLFWKLFFDEESHAQRIRFQKRLVMTDPMNFGQVTADLGKVNEINRRLDDVLGNREIGIEEAVNFAQEIEVGVSEYQLQQAVVASNPKVADLLRSLGGGETEHVQALNDFIRKRFLNLPGRGQRVI